MHLRALTLGALLLTGCALFTRENARTALDVLEMACALQQKEGLSVEAIAQACGVADSLIPALRELLAAKAQARRQSGPECP